MPDRTRLPPRGTWRPIVPTPIRIGGAGPETPPATPTGSSTPTTPTPSREPTGGAAPTGGGVVVHGGIGRRRVVDADVLQPAVVVDEDELPPDPSKMTAREMIDEIHRRTSEVEEHFHAIGTLLRALDDPERLRELGYADIDALLLEEKLPPKPTARRLTMAAVLPLELAKDFGSTRSYELVRWAQEVRGARTDAAVVAIIRATTHIEGVKITEITTRKLKSVIDGPDAGTRASRARTRDGLRDLASGVRKVLKKSGVTSRTTVEEHDDRGPELCVRIGSIEDVQRLLDALDDDDHP